MFVYFDNSATTKTLKKVNEEMLLMLENDYGNSERAKFIVSARCEPGIAISNKAMIYEDLPF